MKQFTTRLFARLILPAFLSVWLAGCVTNPETGRCQLLIVPESQMTQLGISSFDQLKQQTPISRDPAANAMVQQVGERIRSVVNLPNAQWEFVVFDSKEANAFCLPGGKIGVYTGILPLMKEAEADHRGLIYMSKAGYDPEAAVAFWERFAAYGAKAGGSPPKFLSTHPPSAERIQNLKKWMPEAKAAMQPQK